jgi:hypothetical protein
VSGGAQSPATFAVPLGVLADVEGRDETTVTFGAVAPDRSLVRWQDRGIPQAREHAVPAVAGLPAFPDPPPSFEAALTDLLDALVEAARLTSTDNNRYDLRNLQLRAGTTEIAATDGRQLLLRRTERPVWDHDVLVRRTALFAGTALPRDRPLRVGKTDSHVVLRLDDPTIWLAIQANDRFPCLDGVLPADSEPASCLQLDPEDAAFLSEALGRLPGGDGENAPVTVDLNGRVAVRARGEEPQPTELILARSGYTGAPVRFSTNREYLGRALALGLGTIHIAGGGSAGRRAGRPTRLRLAAPEPRVGPRADRQGCPHRIRQSPGVTSRLHDPEDRLARSPSSQRTHDPVSGRRHDAARDSRRPGGPDPRGRGAARDAGAGPEPDGAADRRPAGPPPAESPAQRNDPFAPPARPGRNRRVTPITAISRTRLPDLARGVSRNPRPHGDSPMPLKLNVGVSRKIGLPDYGSIGASCNVELENGLPDEDLEGFHARVKWSYVAAHRAVVDELARRQAVTDNGPDASNGHGEQDVPADTGERPAPPARSRGQWGPSARTANGHTKPPRRRKPARETRRLLADLHRDGDQR